MKYIRTKYQSSDLLFHIYSQGNIADFVNYTGEDVVLSPAAKRLIPYSFECKNVERLDLWKSLEQAVSNCEDRTPVLVFKRNHTKTYVAFEYNKFLELIDEKE